jgi:hypothetical protein
MTAQLATLTAGSPMRSSLRVQRRASAGRTPGTPRSHPARAGRDGHAAIHAAAARGTATPWSALPHAGAIQRSFGRHDISSLQAHVGPAAEAAAAEISADAYTMGNHVVLGRHTDLFTAAHESAHAYQQRAGVRLPGGVGSSGDAHERHADAVAARVAAGQSAEPLLNAYTSQSQAGPQIQRKTWINDRPSPIKYAQGEGPGILASTDAAGNPQEHKVWFAELKNGCGLEVEARLYEDDDVPGSTPSVRPYWWANMMSDPATDGPWVSRNVVQGHLLNEHLGGPGNDMRNLTPFAKQTNSQHHAKVEKAAKAIKFSKNQHGAGNVLHYQIMADYSTHPQPAWFANKIPLTYLKYFAGGVKCWLQAYDGTTLQPTGQLWETEISNAITGQG